MRSHFGGYTPVRASAGQKLLLTGCVFAFSASVLAALLFYLNPETQPVIRLIESSPPPQAEQVHHVLVPLQKIEPSAALSPSMFKKIELPSAAFAPDMVHEFEHVMGTFSTAALLPGRPFYRDHLSTAKPATPVSAIIPEGYLAIAIPVNEQTAVAGWVRPGSFVDIALTTTVRGRQALRIIATNTQVVSAGRSMNSDLPAGTPVPPTVTVMAPQRDIARIALALDMGKLRLLLRGDGARNYKAGELIWLDEDEVLMPNQPKPVLPAFDGWVIVEGQKFWVEGNSLLPAS